MNRISTICFEYESWWKDSKSDKGSRYYPEKYQLGILTHFLQSRDFHYSTEARVFSYPIDILAYKRDATIAIEMKSANSKRGMEQAKRNAEFVDYSFLSVWEENITENLLQRVNGTDIGLISVSDQIRFRSPPKICEKSLYSSDTIRDVVNPDV